MLGKRISVTVISSLVVMVASACLFQSGEPDRVIEDGPSTDDPPEKNLESFQEFSELELPDDKIDAEVFDTASFPNGSEAYWVRFSSSRESAEEMCSEIDEFISSGSDELAEVYAEELRVPTDFLDEHSGEVRECGARMERNNGQAAIFYEGDVDSVGRGDFVTVYLRETSPGR